MMLMKKLQQLLVKKGCISLRTVLLMQLGSVPAQLWLASTEPVSDANRSKVESGYSRIIWLKHHCLHTTWREHQRVCLETKQTLIRALHIPGKPGSTPCHAPLRDFLPCVIHNCVQPVRYCQHRAVFKLGPNRHLDKIIRLEIDRCRCFVEDQDPCLAKQRSRQADELSLAHAANRDGAFTNEAPLPSALHRSESLAVQRVTHPVRLPSKIYSI